MKKESNSDEKNILKSETNEDMIDWWVGTVILTFFPILTSIIINICRKDTMSVRVPDGFLELHRSFKIHSKQFVYETLIGWGLNPEKTYSFKGEYLEEQKMVVFSLKNTD